MEKENVLIFLVVVLGLLSIASLFVVAGNKVDEDALVDKVAAQVISEIPQPESIDVNKLATDVAALITVPEVEVPEFESDEKVQDLWEDLYADEIDELEAEAYDVAVAELEDHDYKALEKYLEANIEGFDELKDVDVDDYEINVIKLGLDDEEDKVAEIVFELEVRYTLDEGVAQKYKKDVIATATVSFDEGDYDDEDVELVFA